ncbi:AAA family ATPase [Desulfobacterales bacterium HSG2]|nr:AAA family ATPase [Desulfobacterales bacterium HSG2]
MFACKIQVSSEKLRISDMLPLVKTFLVRHYTTTFFRFFFNVLKGAADETDTGVGRIFVTGVSPITMDDGISGFNIGRNISLYPEFNEILGFTEQDIRTLLDHYNVTGADSDRITRMMEEWYDGYRFSAGAEKTLFNTDMVLYFVTHFFRSGTPPDNMIDQNVRTDYDKLLHLIVPDRQMNGNFGRLSEIIRTQGTDAATVADSFPVEYLTRPENFVSLLFWSGLLSYSGPGRLCVPNRTVRHMMHGYLRDG